MSEIEEFLEKFFDTGSFPARWYCGKWSEFHGWLYIISDVAIWAAYFTIPILLVTFIRKKKDIPFPRLFWLFGAFILACGATHLIDAIIFWFPIYRISAFVRLLTAVVSWATIIALYRILPQALLLKTPGELERQVQLRTAELNDTIAKMRFMADAMPQMVYTAKPDGTHDYFNRRALEYMGKDDDGPEGWKWTDLMHPDDRLKFLKEWQDSISNGTAFEYEVRILSANGQYYWHLARAVPQHDAQGQVACWVGTATEIEQQKRNAEILENLVLQRTGELRISNDLLLQSNRDLEQFAAFASHDLQVPLRTMSNYLGILEERNRDILDETSNRYINKAINASQRMRNLIQTLLQYSRVQATDATLGEVKLEEVIQVIRTGLADSDSSRQVQINSNVPHNITADESMMTQLLQNLIANGIKYNHSDVVVINIATSVKGDATIITISDNGVGIPEDSLAKIFDVFTRLESGVQGTGLGLSISKRIVEKHNGSITVASEMGLGTTFTIVIPRRSE